MAVLTQLDRQLPLGVSATGKLLSAEEVVLKKIRGEGSSLTLSDMPRSQRKAVVLARLKQKGDYGLVQIGGETVTKEEAVHAVEDDTALGKLVVDLESREMNIVERRLMEELRQKIELKHFSPG